MIPLTIISIMAIGGSIPCLWRSIKAPQTCLCLVVVFPLRVNYRNFASTNWTCIKPGEVNVIWVAGRSHWSRGFITPEDGAPPSESAFRCLLSECNIYLTPQTNSSGNWRDGSSPSTAFSCLSEILRSTWEWGNPIDKAPQPIQLRRRADTKKILIKQLKNLNINLNAIY